MTENQQTTKDELSALHYFPSMVYVVEKPEFLEAAKKVCDAEIKESEKNHDINEIYPVRMTDNLLDHPEMEDLMRYIGQTSWNILKSQGYDMDNFVTTFTEFWCQEHHKHSLMEQHVHGNGAQIVGFYFVEVPEGSSRAVFHDPRVAKVQIDLPETDQHQATIASKMINFQPQEGTLIFANSWLPHSFTRHSSEKPMKFIHFNISVEYVQNQQVCSTSNTEVI